MKETPGRLDKAAAALIQEVKPVIWRRRRGHHLRRRKELLRLAEKIQAPVTTTLMALDAFPGITRLPAHAGDARYGLCQLWVTEADLTIAVGARFDDGHRAGGNLCALKPK